MFSVLSSRAPLAACFSPLQFGWVTRMDVRDGKRYLILKRILAPALPI
jgi:hypothetical protein